MKRNISQHNPHLNTSGFLYLKKTYPKNDYCMEQAWASYGRGAICGPLGLLIRPSEIQKSRTDKGFTA